MVLSPKRYGEGTGFRLPVFGAGHASLPLTESLQAMAETLRDADPGSLREVMIVILQPDRLTAARAVLDRVLSRPPA